jgi:hypothetical protein
MDFGSFMIGFTLGMFAMLMVLGGVAWFLGWFFGWNAETETDGWESYFDDLNGRR